MHGRVEIDHPVADLERYGGFGKAGTDGLSDVGAGRAVGHYQIRSIGKKYLHEASLERQ